MTLAPGRGLDRLGGLLKCRAVLVLVWPDGAVWSGEEAGGRGVGIGSRIAVFGADELEEGVVRVNKVFRVFRVIKVFSDWRCRRRGWRGG